MDTFDDPVLAGPVPIFFADDPAAALRYLTDHPVTTRDDIAAANAHFLHTENLSLPDAQTYLRKRTRVSRGTPAFPPVRPPAAKRRKTTEPVETGTFSPFHILIHNHTRYRVHMFICYRIRC